MPSDESNRVQTRPRDLEIPVFAGADVFANKGDENAKTIAQQYASFVSHVAGADGRISGWGEMLDLLGDPGRKENPIAARLKITKDCERLIECIPLATQSEQAGGRVEVGRR